MSYGWGRGWGYSYGLADPVNLLIPYENFLPWQNTPSYAGRVTGISPGSIGLYEIDELSSGSLDALLPIELASDTGSAARLRTFYDDFYERVYVFPSTMNFGIIVGDTYQNVEVWNAHLSSVTMSLVDDSALSDQGVSVDATYPTILPALSSNFYAVNAELAGTTEVSGDIYFTFNTGEVRLLSVEGIRGLLWPFLPNWSGGFRQTYEYKTEVITSYSGMEQRIAMRETPRKTIGYTVHVHHEDRRALNRLLDMYQHVEFVVPDIPRHMVAVDGIPAGITAFEVDEIPDWLEVGQLLVTLHDGVPNLRRVLSFDSMAKTVTFENDGVAMPEGSLVCAGIVGYLDPSISTRRLTNEVVEMRFVFEAKPGFEDAVEPPDADVSYLGREVFLEKPDWADPLAVDFQRQVDLLDYGRGVTKRFNPTDFGIRVLRATFTNMDYWQFRRVLDLYTRMRGQRGEFYMPTWEDDLSARSSLAAGTAKLRVRGPETAETYANSTVFKHLMVQLKDGSRLFRGVNSIVEVDDMLGNDSEITVDSIWGSEVTVDQIDMICWMPVYRLAGDGITIEWLTDDKSRLQLNLRTVESLPVE